MINFEILKNLNIEMTPDIENNILKWEKLFIKYNSHTNLMSKNDISVLFEKHVYDSLAINLWQDFQNKKSMLDVGCGGGFPSVILAIFYKDKKIIANDSRIKKINFIKEIKDTLKLDNLEILYSRIEEVKPLNVDLITSRAVGRILEIYELSKKHIKNNGNFVFYKAKTTQEEIVEFQKKYKGFKFDIIPYNLPLKENFERKLVIML